MKDTQIATLKFIEKAVAVHGMERYGYSQTVYIRAHIKVRILCPIHGIFEQQPTGHLGGKGCKKCAAVAEGLSKRAAAAQRFLQEARAAHGDKYDYSQVVYVGSKGKVRILCPIHGLFEQAPVKHILQGQGCRRCGKKKAGEWRILTQDAFLKKAHDVHGDKYDYSQAKYIASAQKLTIICPSHGAFEQTPNGHLDGNGCPRCANATHGIGRGCNPIDNFLLRAKEVHGDKYDYSQAAYTGRRNKLTIVCPEHGAFNQVAGKHLCGQGCGHCARKAVWAVRLKTLADFLVGARAVHGDRYDYSISEFRGMTSKITIVCRQHGAFMQVPYSHIAKSGCPACARADARLTWIERANGRLSTLYFLRIYSNTESFYKVGVTHKTVANRYSGKRPLGGYQYEVLALLSSINAAAIYDWEQSILETFKHLRYTPKIYFDGQTETFSSCDEILEIFPVAG